jgi:large subunit ribosomal protein L22
VIAKATAKYVRVSPRKVRMVISSIRGKSIPQALSILLNINKAARRPVEKVLRSAITNAEMKMPSSKAESFYISKITADEGPMLKRYRAAPMGRATMIRKRTTHILVELDVKEKQQISKHGKR